MGFLKKQTKQKQEIKASECPPGSSEESIHSFSLICACALFVLFGHDRLFCIP